MNVIEKGICICICQPMGKAGLEGYQLDNKYKYEEVINVLDRKYYRLYPEEGLGHYEIASTKMFNKYFKIK